MPIYQYRCESCGVSFERIQSFSDQPLQHCPECDGSVHRVIQPVGIIFKGSGFYVTDNRRNTALLPGKREDSSETSTKDTSGEAETKTSETPKSTEN
jgi:putative FmdB family regulatory protein